MEYTESPDPMKEILHFRVWNTTRLVLQDVRLSREELLARWESGDPKIIDLRDRSRLATSIQDCIYIRYSFRPGLRAILDSLDLPVAGNQGNPNPWEKEGLKQWAGVLRIIKRRIAAGREPRRNWNQRRKKREGEALGEERAAKRLRSAPGLQAQPPQPEREPHAQQEQNALQYRHANPYLQQAKQAHHTPQAATQIAQNNSFLQGSRPQSMQPIRPPLQSFQLMQHIQSARQIALNMQSALPPQLMAHTIEHAQPAQQTVQTEQAAGSVPRQSLPISLDQHRLTVVANQQGRNIQSTQPAHRGPVHAQANPQPPEPAQDNQKFQPPSSPCPITISEAADAIQAFENEREKYEKMGAAEFRKVFFDVQMRLSVSDGTLPSESKHQLELSFMALKGASQSTMIQDEDPITIQAKLSDRDEMPLRVKISKKQPVWSVARRILEESTLLPPKYIKLAWMGKSLKMNQTLEAQGWKEGQVLTAFVFG